ncbi:MAG: glycoside hydrolase [Actinobacteria bacterium]|nr:glycoside hydrolase [Actinomycetota bacterium]
MVGKFRIRLLAAAAVLALVSTPAAAQDARSDVQPVVTNAVQVTTNPNPTRAHSSPQISRNPQTGELVIVETDVYGGFGVNVHVSGDGGRTWAPGGDPMMKPYTWNSDYAINGPYVTSTFDKAGVLYLAFTAADPATAALNRAERPRPLFVARSDDGGRRFTTTMAYAVTESDPKTINNRRGRIALDPKTPANVYVGWIQSSMGAKARSMTATSTDGGKTFGPAVDLADAEPQGGYDPRMAVTPDGVVHAVTPGGGYAPTPPAGTPAADPLVRPLSYRQSKDQGKTWSPPVVIDQGSAGFSHNRKQTLVADPGSGNLYLAWYGNAKTRPGPEDDNEILLRVSRDGGQTWGERITVNDDAASPNTQHYNPGVSIAPNGRVDIAWYDFRNSPAPEIQANAAPFNNGGMTDVYYASSSDGGRTFGKNIRISDRSADRSIGVWSNNVHSHFTVGITSANDGVYMAWQDSRNGNSITDSEDVYFASLLLDAPGLSVGNDAGVPGWVLAGAGVAGGMGLAMLLVFLISRRSRPEAATAGG